MVHIIHRAGTFNLEYANMKHNTRTGNVRIIPIDKSSEQNLKKRLFIHAVLSEKAVFSKWQYFKRKARYSRNNASVSSIVPLLRNQVASQLHFSFRINWV